MFVEHQEHLEKTQARLQRMKRIGINVSNIFEASDQQQRPQRSRQPVNYSDYFLNDEDR